MVRSPLPSSSISSKMTSMYLSFVAANMHVHERRLRAQ